MKKNLKFLYLLILSIFILFTSRAYSKIGTAELTDYTIPGQGILPNTNYSSDLNNGYIIIAGLNIASDTGQRLTGITVTNNGDLDIDRYAVLSRGGSILGSSATGTISLNVLIPADDEGGNEGDDFFIAIRTTDNATMDQASSFTIGTVTWTPVEDGDAASPTLTTNTITCELIVADLLPVEYTNVPDHNSTPTPEYPYYFQWQPGEQIRPNYQSNSYDLSPSPLQHNVPQVIPWETPTAILAIGCSQRNVLPSGTATPNIQDPAETLSSITLTITDVGKSNFDPTKSFRNGYTDGQYNGIQLWKDVNQNGIWDPTVDTLVDTIVSITPSGVNEWKATIVPSGEDGETIEDLYDGIYDYFIVIVVRSNPDDPSYRPIIGQDYKIWINPGDIVFGPVSHPVKYAGISISKVKTIYNNLYLEDVSQSRIDPEENDAPVDLTDNVIPVIGINIASGPSTISDPAPDLGSFSSFDGTRIKNIRVDLLSFENFDPRTDLAPLSTTPADAAGITLWRDNKDSGNTGSFDSVDTFVPTNSSGWIDDGFVNDPVYGPVHLYHCIISTLSSASDTGDIYSDDTSADTGVIFNHTGDDFFVCIRADQQMSYGAKFFVRIPEDGGLTLTYPVDGRYNSLPAGTSLITGNVFVKITSLTDPGNPGLSPNSDPTPIFKVELNDNESGKTPKLEQMTVEFYNRGDFSLDDIASFDPIFPVFNPSTGWYDITNFDINALKQCGVVIYQDNGDGVFNENTDTPVLISRYRIPSYPGAPSGYQFEFLTPIFVPSTLFVVIRTSDTFTPGDSFDCGIVGWGLNSSDWETWGSRAIGIVDVDDIQSNVYVRAQSGTFNPDYLGSLLTDISSEFEGIWVYWQNNTSISQDRFLYYEVLREDTSVETPVFTSIYTTFDYNANSYFNSIEGPFPPQEGVQYMYLVRMHYLQAGEEKTFDSNISPDPSDPYYFHKGRILGWPSYMAPDDVTAVGGINSITVYWRDKTYDPYHPENRATQFMVRRVKLSDNTYFETPVAAHIEPDWVDYTYVDSGVETAVDYRYEIYAQRYENGGIVESFPGISEPVQAYGEQPDEGAGGAGGGGGCFIATAAYGSYQEKHVWILRQFRDKYLLTNRPGRAFVRWYYKHSPKYASIIARHNVLRSITRVFLTPLYVFALLLLKLGYFVALFFPAAVLTYAVRKRVK